MNIIKHISLFIWALLLLGIICFLIKQLAFGKRKSHENINMSEAIYLASLIISAGLIFQKVMQSISIAFDSISKIQPTKIYFQFIKTSSAISVSGIILFIISLYVTKYLSTLFFGNRQAIVEFDSENKAYALIRGALMFTITLVLLQLGENIFSYLIPGITLPFYR